MRWNGFCWSSPGLDELDSEVFFVEMEEELLFVLWLYLLLFVLVEARCSSKGLGVVRAALQ